VHKLAQSILAYIRKHDLSRAGDRVGIAVSGGADSVALSRLLIELRPQLGIVLSVVHLNHKLRGEDSNGDQEFVRALAAQHRLEFFTKSVDVKAYAAEKKLSLETAARRLRYHFFESKLRDGTLNRIATAHTLDDQAETVILKLARGAGTRGAAGIYPKLSIQQSALSGHAETAIVRPLLKTRHRDLELYLHEVGQSWREDASNRDLRHTRNRVRHGILPRLEQHVNPAVRDALAETAEIARAEEEYWAGQLKVLLPDLWSETEAGGSLNARCLRKLPLAVQRRIVRAAAESLGLVLEFSHVEDVIALHEDGGAALPESWIARASGDEILFGRDSDQYVDSDYEYQLPVPGLVRVIEAGVSVETVIVNDFRNSGECSSEQLLDPAAAKQGLCVRPWRAGERFWPAHTKEPKKIKELLQHHHITGVEKKRWPVVASGGEVVWVGGLGVRRDFRSKGVAGVLIRELPLERHDR
jgi:tRNA(Ile)-lysidine synthase